MSESVSFFPHAFIPPCLRVSPPSPAPLSLIQMAKLDAIIAAAELKADDHVLEIGCGWGGFAIRAAQTTGCRVTGAMHVAVVEEREGTGMCGWGGFAIRTAQTTRCRVTGAGGSAR